MKNLICFICTEVFLLWIGTATGQTIAEQPLYKKYIGSKLSEKYKIPSEDAGNGVSSNPLSLNSASGYGLATFTFPFDGSVLQRGLDDKATVSFCGQIDKSLIDNGYTNFRIGVVKCDPSSNAPTPYGLSIPITFSLATTNRIVGDVGVFHMFIFSVQ